MTVQVGMVNLLLETHGGVHRQGDATWYLPIFQHFGALLLYSFAYLGSCLLVLNLFHHLEFAAMFVPGKRNANPSNYHSAGVPDINGDALHASLGLPPALAVDTARVGELQITVR